MREAILLLISPILVGIGHTQDNADPALDPEFMELLNAAITAVTRDPESAVKSYCRFLSGHVSNRVFTLRQQFTEGEGVSGLEAGHLLSAPGCSLFWVYSPPAGWVFSMAICMSKTGGTHDTRRTETGSG